MFIDQIRLLLLVQLLAYNCSGALKNKKEYIQPFNFNFLKKENNFVNLQKLNNRKQCSNNFGNFKACDSSHNPEGVNLFAIRPVNLIEVGKGSLNPINRIIKRPNLICQYINLNSNIFTSQNKGNLSYSSRVNLKNIKEEYFKKQKYQNFKTYSEDKLNNIIRSDNQKKENKMKFRKGKVLMSYFRNRQGLKIRTYASEVDNPLGKVFLVHGIRSHFRAEFTGYNIDWYFNNIGESKTETAHQTQEMEKRMVFPSKNQRQLVKGGGEDYSTLDGKDVLEVTPRFIYEGTFLEYLNNLGYSTYGLDLQSQGMSESVTERRCYFEKFDDVCYDLLQFITLVKKGNFHDTNQTYKEEEVFEKEKEEKNFTTSNLYGSKNYGLNVEEKYYLMGMSMGGNVVMRAMELYAMKMGKNKKVVDALVCLAGMINIDFHFKGLLGTCLPLIKFVSKLKSGLKAGKPGDPGLCLTSLMRSHDPLFYIDKLYVRMAIMLRQATKTLERDFEFYPTNLPTLFLHTENDTMCDVKGPRHLMARYFRGVEHVRFHELEGEAHVISSPLFTTVTGPLVEKFLQDEQNKWSND